MNLLILGQGKTGTMVTEVARERGHQVETMTSAENPGGAALTAARLAGTDVVIDFTTPQSVVLNITACAAAKVSMVVGTTGWYGHLDQVRELVALHGTGFVHGSNFSIGVNVFFGIMRAAAAALPFGYLSRIMERHHAEKKDSPSGTAATMRQILQDYGGVTDGPEIASIREGDAVGTHVLFLDSDHDSMMLVHDAKSRRGYAEGAVRAAEWLHGRTGFHDFRDIFREL